MTVTPEQLRAALADPRTPTVAAACRACGISRQAADKRPDLKAVLEEHRQRAKPPRDAQRKLGTHNIALPPATWARLAELSAAATAELGRKAGSKAAVARRLILEALEGALPAPVPGERGLKAVLDLGPAWDAVGERAGTKEPAEIAGIIRAILAGRPGRKGRG